MALVVDRPSWVIALFDTCEEKQDLLSMRERTIRMYGWVLSGFSRTSFQSGGDVNEGGGEHKEIPMRCRWILVLE